MSGPVTPAAAAIPAGNAGTSAGTTATVAAAVPEPAGEATLEQLPDKLKELLRTVVVSGTVIEQTGGGNVKIRTQAGEVSLKTPTPLPQDRQVTLQIPPGNPPVKALVFMVGPPLPQTTAPMPATAPTVPPNAVAVPAPPPQVKALSPPPPTGVPVPAVAPHVAVPVAAPVAVGTVIPATVASISPPPVQQASAAPQTPAAPPIPVPPSQQPSRDQAPASAPAPTPQTPAPPDSQGTRTPPAPTPPATPQTASAPTPVQPPPQQTRTPPAAPAPPASTPAAPPVQAAPVSAASGSVAPTAPAPAPASTPAPAPTPVPAQPAAQQMPALKPGNAVEVRVVALPPQQGATPTQSQPSPSPASPPAAASAPPTLAATVAGTTSAGQPIVTTDRGVMVLNTRTPLAPGTQVTIGLPPAHPAPAETFDPLRGQDWPALSETLDVLAKADPLGTRTLANAILPQANGRLAATLMTFTGTVKKGDARAWLGEKATKALEALGRTDLLEKLDDDFKQLARQAAEVSPGDWKPYSIPFSDGTELHRILMHVRQPDADEVDEDANGADGHGARANRFLIDLTLSRIGELQLDGLIRPRRFDLILRTHMPLPPEMRQEIGKLFHNSLETLGMTGAVSFQAGTQGWVAIQPGPSGRVGMSA